MSIDKNLESGDRPVYVAAGLAPAVPEPEHIPRRPRKRNMTVFMVACLLSVGLLVLLWTQLITPHATHSPDDPSLAGEVSSPLVGKAAPDFTLPILGGKGAQLHLANLKGKVVILNFWASWCDPCKQEAPFLEQTWTRIQSQRAVMIGVDSNESSEGDPLNFLRQYDITYPNVRDTLQGSTAIDYGTTGQPETFFINRNGMVVSHWFGPLTEDGMRRELAKLQVTLK